MTQLLAVLAGGAVGAGLRWGVVTLSLRLWGLNFPWGTLAVNVVGGVAMGFAVTWFTLRTGISDPMKLFLTTGLLGGFTTFSAFSLDVVRLMERGEMGSAVGYAAGSVVLSVLGVLAGFAAARMVGA